MLFFKKQQATVYVIAAAIVCGVMLFGYLPLGRKLSALKRVRASQSLAISRASYQSQRLPEMKKQLVKLQTQVGNFERNVPEQRELGTFLQEIAALMNGHELTEQLIEPGKETKVEQLNCIPVNMQCSGSLEQLFEFFQQLQRLDRVMRIENVSLVNDSGFNGKVKMQTKAAIYYRKDSQQD